MSPSTLSMQSSYSSMLHPSVRRRYLLRTQREEERKLEQQKQLEEQKARAASIEPSYTSRRPMVMVSSGGFTRLLRVNKDYGGRSSYLSRYHQGSLDSSDSGYDRYSRRSSFNNNWLCFKILLRICGNDIWKRHVK